MSIAAVGLLANLATLDLEGLRQARAAVVAAGEAVGEPTMVARLLETIDVLIASAEEAGVGKKPIDIVKANVAEAAAFSAELENAALAYPDPAEPGKLEFVIVPRCRCTRETPNAILVEDARGAQWIPKRAIPWNSPVIYVGTQGELYILAWFARKKWWTP